MHIDRPEITIILLTHGRPQGLLRAVESVYSQTFKSFELIILDNGNPLDYSDSILSYILTKKNLRYIRLEKNETFIGKRLNQGISLAKGNSIAFLTDDDTWMPYSLKLLQAKLELGFDMVYGRVRSIDYTTGKQVSNSYALRDWGTGVTRRLNSIHLTSVIIKKTLFNRIGGFNENLSRGYDLDLWNRVFIDSKCFRLDQVISEISVNNLKSVTGLNKLIPIETMQTYPLANYWVDRKSVSFMGEERDFINLFNSRHHPWVATSGAPLTDSNISWGYCEELESVTGAKFYYLDHPSVVDPRMLEWCDGVISQFPFETEKPSHILRPTISFETLRILDQRVYQYHKNLRILCPKITEDNLDFIYILMDYVADRYSAVYIYFHPNLEARSMLDSIPNVLPRELRGDSYEDYKHEGMDVVLHIDGDSNNYIDAYKSFLISSAIQAPLVSSPNIAYSNILEDKIDLFIVDKVQSFIMSIDKAKELSIRGPMLHSVRKKTFLYFLDDIVLDKFTLFLDENKKSLPESDQVTAGISQLESNTFVIIRPEEYISQSFTVNFDSFKGFNFYGEVLNNYEGSLRFDLSTEGSTILEGSIPNYKLRNGENTITFPRVHTSLGSEFIISFYSAIPIFKMDCSNVVRSIGSYYSNSKAKKACLKFRVLV